MVGWWAEHWIDVLDMHVVLRVELHLLASGAWVGKGFVVRCEVKLRSGAAAYSRPRAF